MSPFIVRHITIATALAFAAWVFWLWIDPLKMENVQKPIKEQPKQIVQLEKPKTSAQPRPQVYTLPTPPQPVQPVVVPAQKPMKKAEPAKPIQKKEAVKAAPKPSPKPIVRTKPKPVIKKSVARKSTPKSAPAPKPVKLEPKIHEVTQAEAVGGRTLLRVLEHGKGPQIEIVWPQNARARENLFQKFQNCFGMENALMDREGNLFRTDDPRGMRWEINLDRYSGFLRQASGRLPQIEERIMDQISRRHGHLSNPVPVRVFPRRVDASLLGGLKAVIGDSYMSAKAIQARYDVNGVITDIRIDGRNVSGQVKMAQFKRCSWRV